MANKIEVPNTLEALSVYFWRYLVDWEPVKVNGVGNFVVRYRGKEYRAKLVVNTLQLCPTEDFLDTDLIICWANTGHTCIPVYELRTAVPWEPVEVDRQAVALEYWHAMAVAYKAEIAKLNTRLREWEEGR